MLNAHNGWHSAVFLLEREDHPGALAIYDCLLHHAASPGIALEMLDVSGLLWRMSLDGVDTGGRWAALADAWAANDPTPWYAFNDLHAIMAFVGAGRQALAEQRAWHPPAPATRRAARGQAGQPLEPDARPTMARAQRARALNIAQWPLACAASASPKVSHGLTIATVRPWLTISASLSVKRGRRWN